MLLQRNVLRATIQQLEQGPTEEDLLFGLNTMGLSETEGPDMFQCQIKLFTGWWRNWSHEDRQLFINSINNIR